MNDRRMAAIVRKEWRELFANPMALMTFSGLPVVMVGMLLGAAGWIQSLDGESDTMQELAEALPEALSFLTPKQGVLVLMNDNFAALLLIVPVMLPIASAAFSIIGEKEERTIEPLLASPVTTAEILAAKTFAFCVPGLVVTVLSYAAAAVGLFFMVDPVVFAIFVQPAWTLGVMLISPPLAVGSTLLGLIASCRASDPKSAQNVAVMFILPLTGLSTALMLGLFRIDLEILGYAGAAVVVVDIVLLRLAARWFEREKIISDWK